MPDASTVTTALRDYIETLESLVGGSVRPRSNTSPTELSPGDAEELRRLVGQAESGPIFHKLAIATRMKQVDIFPIDSIKNFLRRSGTYLSIYRGRPLDLDILAATYIELFSGKKRIIKHRYLAPIDAVWFGQNDVDIGDFHITQFSVAELSHILDNTNNKVFYPGCSGNIDVLVDHWFIDLSWSYESSYFEFEEDDAWTDSPGHNVDFDAFDRVDKEFTTLPKPVEAALRLLTLWDWEKSHKDRPRHRHSHAAIDRSEGWYKFSIPAVLSLDDDWLSSPSVIPEVPDIDMEGVLEEEGEEVGRCPMYVCSVSDIGEFTARLKALRNAILIASAKQEWQFISLALGFLTKAFLTNGIDELLWHIVTLESLLGDKSDVSNTLQSRLAAILGYSGAGNSIKELYDFRSKLVHGSISYQTDEIFLGHLREARKLARLAVVWFLHCISKIDESLRLGLNFVPDRECVLKAIDLFVPSVEKLRSLLQVLPKDFPSVEGWRGYFDA